MPEIGQDGQARKFRVLALKTITAATIGVPTLLIVTCTYTSYSPHLRLDPVLVAIMDAPRHPEHGWATQHVPLTPTLFQAGEKQEHVMAKLGASGFRLQAYYSPETGITYDRPAGVPHTFQREGRIRPACSETLIVEAEFAAGVLERINGSATWTCL